jgi:hypothetical protein
MKHFSRFGQGAALWAIMLVAITSVLLLANIGAPEACRVEASGRAIGCFLRAYRELAAGLLAAAGAIFAAWLAWTAVRDQIRRTDELASAGARETHFAICEILLEDFLGTIDAAWRAVDLALAPGQNAEQRHGTEVLAQVTFVGFPNPTKGFVALEELMPGLAVLEKRRLAFVIMALRWVYKAKNAAIDKEEPDALRWKLRSVQTMMSHLHKFLLSFDGDLAAVFEGREKTPVDHTPIAASLHKAIDEFERNPQNFRAAIPKH